VNGEPRATHWRGCPATGAGATQTEINDAKNRMLDSRIPIAIAVVEREGFFLVGKRPAGAPLAGLCEFPGGKVHASETPEAAAVRECLEETDLAVRIVGEYPVVRHDYEHDRVELHFFRCLPVDAGCSPREPFRWVTVAELAELQFPEANRAVLDQIIAAERSSRGVASRSAR
jgi:8-oxo-dGTP diphosphatase